MNSLLNRYSRIGLALFVAVLLIVAFSASASASGPTYVTVLPGQTLYSISAYYGVNVWVMACANGLSNPNYIYAGMVLRVPYGGYGSCGMSYGGYYNASYGYNGYYHPPVYHPPVYYPHAADCFYRVRWGDTLFSIAGRYGTTAWALAAANGLANPNLIYAGMVLRIPGCN